MCVCVCVFPLVWGTNSSRKDSQYLPLALTLSPREIPVFKRKQFSQPTSRVLRVSMSSPENGATEVEWGPNSRGHSSHTTNPKNKSSLINAPPEQHKKDGGRNWWCWRQVSRMNRKVSFSVWPSVHTMSQRCWRGTYSSRATPLLRKMIGT